MAYQKLTYRHDASVARITLNRPDKRNALDSDLIAELKDAIANSDHLILLSGAGRDFCSGMDLRELKASADGTVLDHRNAAQSLADLFLAMRRHPRPIIAAVRGRALAGGCGLATAADIILASDTAQFGYPEVNIGFVPAIVLAFLRRSVPEKRAFELVASGDAINASEALECGLVNRVFPDQSFDTDVDAYAARFAAKSPSALALVKSLLYRTDSLSLEAAIQAGVEINAIARMTDDCRRGVESFLKKPGGRSHG